LAALLSASTQGTIAADSASLDNGRVKAVFTLQDNCVTQSYFAQDGSEWLLIAESFIPPSPYPKQASQLYNSQADPTHRFVVPQIMHTIKVLDSTDTVQTVVLSGQAHGVTITQKISLRHGEDHFHVVVNATLPEQNPQLDVIVSPYVFAIEGTPDFTHAPSFKPSQDDIIGDTAFLSPAALAQQGGRFIAIVPDLDAINAHAIKATGARKHPDSNSFPIDMPAGWETMPTALDLDLQSQLTPKPLLSFGMMDHIVKQHVHWLRDNSPGAMVRTLSHNEVVYAFDLFVSATAPPRRGFQNISQYFWKTYGAKMLQQPRPQAMPFASYAEVCYPAYAKYQGYRTIGVSRIENIDDPTRRELNSWQEWELNGQMVGGFRLTAPQWNDLVYNTSWWNNVCDATGLYYWGQTLQNQDWTNKARRIINFTLMAPQDHGVFPSLYSLKEKRWIGSLWRPPRENYDPAVQQHIWDSENGVYMSASASTTAGYLLQYYNTCEADERIIPYVMRYADFLVANMQPNGNVPAWFDLDLQPLPSMREFNADGGVHIWVLTELYRRTHKQKYLDASRTMADFLIAEVLPNQRWSDFETFYSCANKPETFFDSHTGQPGRDLMAVIWALNGLTSLYEVSGDVAYLDAAVATADFGVLFQDVWQPHYVQCGYTFGGTVSQLGDGDRLDLRSHRFAGPMVKLGLLADRKDLVERGIAYSRAAFTLINHPRHKSNDIYGHSVFPLGISGENGTHEGFPQTPLGSGPSWSSVGALAGAAHIAQQLGGAYIDLSTGERYGVDGVRIGDVRLRGRELQISITNALATLPMPYEYAYPIKLKVRGLPDSGAFSLSVNGQRKVSATANDLADYTITINPSGEN
jgi:hypothetical protein